VAAVPKDPSTMADPNTGQRIARGRDRYYPKFFNIGPVGFTIVL
jgi:hypothetical protein